MRTWTVDDNDGGAPSGGPTRLWLSPYTRYTLRVGPPGPDCMAGHLAHPVEVRRWRAHAAVWDAIEADADADADAPCLVRERFAAAPDDALSADAVARRLRDAGADVLVVDGRRTGARWADPGTLAYALAGRRAVARLRAAALPACQTIDATLASLADTGRLRVAVWRAPRAAPRPVRSWADTLRVVRDGGTVRWMPDVSVAGLGLGVAALACVVVLVVLARRRA